eukprot:Skav211963  [mRNA]  locus=scaffold433:279098:285174:+ [translate_table: standard]
MLEHRHSLLIGCIVPHEHGTEMKPLPVTQKASGPTSQFLGDLASNGANLLVLHEVFVHQMAKAEANGQVAGEEGVWHWLSPELPGNHLLVEDLADRSMHDEHGEGQGSQGGHGLGPEEASDGRWALAQGIAVHGLQELGEQRYEENSANDGVIEVKLGHTEKQRRIGFMGGFFLSSSVSNMTWRTAMMPIVISIRAQKGWKRVRFQISGCITFPSTGCSLLLWNRAVSE